MRLDEQRDAPWQQQCKRRRTKLLVVAFYEPDDGGGLKGFFFLYFVHHTHSQYTQTVRERNVFLLLFYIISANWKCACEQTKNVIKPVRVTYYYNLAKIIMRFSINTKYYIMGAMQCSCINWVLTYIWL